MICRDVNTSKRGRRVVKKGCGKNHRKCTAYKSCKDFIATAKYGRNVRDIREEHYHLCTGGLIYPNALIDFFSI